MSSLRPAATTIQTGEITGTTQAVQLPNIPCSYVKIKAQSGNTANVYLGTSKNVTRADGVGDSTTGFELDAGQEVELFIDNLNKLWLIADTAGDDITYIALS